jgi:hypothetical protein
MKIKLIAALCGILSVSSASAAVAPINAPRVGTDAVIIASLPASTSPDVARSRVNAMIGLAGGSVPTDRSLDPAAWHVLSDSAVGMNALQWFDVVTTTFPSWLGSTNPAFASQRGHRIVIHASGNGPVSSYMGTVSTTLTNSGLNATYPIGTNTSTGAEIRTGPNFVLINFGADGTNNSGFDTITGRYIAGGDDTVYDNGELPSTVTYHWWVRFGATAVINVSNAAELSSVRDQFARTNQFITAGLVRSVGGTNITVSSRTPVASQARLAISMSSSNMVRLQLTGGQQGLAHAIEMKDDFTNAWTRIPSQSIFSGGSAVDLPNEGNRRFYRAVTP